MAYPPKSGDIIRLDFDPRSGHEQRGRHPALVVWGDDALSLIPGMSQVCAVSNTDNGFTLHVPLDGACQETSGFVLCEQNKVLGLYPLRYWYG